MRPWALNGPSICIRSGIKRHDAAEVCTGLDGLHGAGGSVRGWRVCTGLEGLHGAIGLYGAGESVRGWRVCTGLEGLYGAGGPLRCEGSDPLIGY